ncbi:MAG: glutaredoxin family protein [Actinomycetota bacterium]
MRAQPRIVMYSRPVCGLCDEAREIILAERRMIPFDFEEISIEGDDDLEREFGIRIPVVLVDDEELFEYRIEPELLSAALRK